MSRFDYNEPCHFSPMDVAGVGVGAGLVEGVSEGSAGLHLALELGTNHVVFVLAFPYPSHFGTDLYNDFFGLKRVVQDGDGLGFGSAAGGHEKHESESQSSGL